MNDSELQRSLSEIQQKVENIILDPNKDPLNVIVFLQKTINSANPENGPTLSQVLAALQQGTNAAKVIRGN